jgi:hypothetical protein
MLLYSAQIATTVFLESLSEKASSDRGARLSPHAAAADGVRQCPAASPVSRRLAGSVGVLDVSRQKEFRR